MIYGRARDHDIAVTFVFERRIRALGNLMVAGTREAFRKMTPIALIFVARPHAVAKGPTDAPDKRAIIVMRTGRRDMATCCDQCGPRSADAGKALRRARL